VADLGCGDAKLASTLSKDSGKLNVKILSFDLHNPSPLVQRADIANLPLEDGSVNIAIFCLALMGTNWPDFIDEAYRILHWKGELWVAEIKSRFGRVEGKKDGMNKVVEHSVGNRKKKPRSKMSEAEKRRADNLKQDEDDTLAVEVDGMATSSAGRAGTNGDETDVSAFLKVLATRGFVPDGDESEAVERGNKMFVKMRFLKAAQPTKGKNVVKGKEGATWKPKGKKFLDGKGDEDIDEGKILKPCVYKLR
jgi:ribosomal RNA-processing protein 8